MQVQTTIKAWAQYLGIDMTERVYLINGTRSWDLPIAGIRLESVIVGMMEMWGIEEVGLDFIVNGNHKPANYILESGDTLELISGRSSHYRNEIYCGKRRFFEAFISDDSLRVAVGLLDKNVHGSQ